MARPSGPSFFDHFRRKPLPRVFVGFRGEELRNNFVSHLVRALKDAGVNVFIDSHELRKRDLRVLLRRIEISKIALVIFSERFAETEYWPLREVVKIAERVREGNLVVIPVFYRVSFEDVYKLEGKFGDCFVETVSKLGDCFVETVLKREEDDPLCQRWYESVRFIAIFIGFTSEVHSIDGDLVEEIVKDIKRQLPYLSPAKLELQIEFSRELFFASLVSIICYFLIPSLFTDATFFSGTEWYLAVLILFIVRKIYCFLES